MVAVGRYAAVRAIAERVRSRPKVPTRYTPARTTCGDRRRNRIARPPTIAAARCSRRPCADRRGHRVLFERLTPEQVAEFRQLLWVVVGNGAA
jgi:hypothetical protein